MFDLALRVVTLKDGEMQLGCCGAKKSARAAQKKNVAVVATQNRDDNFFPQCIVTNFERKLE